MSTKNLTVHAHKLNNYACQDKAVCMGSRHFIYTTKNRRVTAYSFIKDKRELCSHAHHLSATVLSNHCDPEVTIAVGVSSTLNTFSLTLV